MFSQCLARCCEVHPFSVDPVFSWTNLLQSTGTYMKRLSINRFKQLRPSLLVCNFQRKTYPLGFTFYRIRFTPFSVVQYILFNTFHLEAFMNTSRLYTRLILVLALLTNLNLTDSVTAFLSGHENIAILYP